jgi:hypothetical protein
MVGIMQVTATCFCTTLGTQQRYVVGAQQAAGAHAAGAHAAGAQAAGAHTGGGVQGRSSQWPWSSQTVRVCWTGVIRQTWRTDCRISVYGTITVYVFCTSFQTGRQQV